MFVQNNNGEDIQLFNTVIKPGKSQDFFFSTPVVDVEITKGGRIIYTGKLPSDVKIEVYDNVVIDDAIILESFENTQSSSSMLLYSLFVIGVGIFLLFILCKNA